MDSTPFSTGFRTGQELLFFSAARPHIQLIRFFGEASPPTFSVPDLCRPSGLASFICATGACDVLRRVIASDLVITQKPRISSDPFYTRAVTAISKHMGTFLLSARFCNHHCRTSVDSDFSIGLLSSFLFWKLISIQLEFSRQNYFFPQISLPDI